MAAPMTSCDWRYRALMGLKHPQGLGQPTRECWPEVWHINEPTSATGSLLQFVEPLAQIMIALAGVRAEA